MIQSETATGIVLLAPEGRSETILRSRIRSFRSTGASLMPSGLESGLSGEDVGSLVHWIRRAAGTGDR